MIGAVLTLLQQRDPEPGFSFENLIQIAIVVIFFVLPGLKSLFEVRKRRGQAPDSPPARSARKAREVTTQGRDLWREILGGGTPQAPARPPSPVLRPKPVSRRATREPRPGAPGPASVLRPERSSVPAPARSPASVEPGPQRAAEQVLGQLDVRIPPTSVQRLEPAVQPHEVLDPATLDDELGRRWGDLAPAAVVAQGAPQVVLGPVDWRRAVLLSELVSPPLALRGQTSAFPGPPASLSG